MLSAQYLACADLSQPLLPKMDCEVVRWYILRLPERHRGHATALEKAKAVRLEQGDTSFDYLAPTFKEKRIQNGREKLVEVSTLFNYVFVYSSVDVIRQLKKTVLSAYNFLKRYQTRDASFYPYVNNETMDTLRWVVASYKNVIPCYIPSRIQLRQGDIIRFTAGSLAGRIAEIVRIPGTRHKEFVVRVKIENGSARHDNELFSIPLNIEIAESSYVVERLNVEDKQLYARLDNTKLLKELYIAIARQRQTQQVEEDIKVKAANIIRQYGSVTNATTDIVRSKLFSYLLPAYKLLGYEDEYEETKKIVSSFVDTISSSQMRILLCLTLFACTGEYYWHTRVSEQLKVTSTCKCINLYVNWQEMLVRSLKSQISNRGYY